MLPAVIGQRDSSSMAGQPDAAVVGVRAPHDVAWHSIADVGKVLKELDTDMERGLTSEEAARRLQMCVSPCAAL